MMVALPSPASVPLELVGRRRIRPRLAAAPPPRPGSRRRRRSAGRPARSGAFSTGTPLTSTPLVLFRSWTTSRRPRAGSRRGSGRRRRPRGRRRCRSPAPADPAAGQGDGALLTVDDVAQAQHGGEDIAGGEHGRARTNTDWHRQDARPTCPSVSSVSSPCSPRPCSSPSALESAPRGASAAAESNARPRTAGGRPPPPAGRTGCRRWRGSRPRRAPGGGRRGRGGWWSWRRRCRRRR